MRSNVHRFFRIPTMMIVALSSFAFFWSTLKDVENGRYTEDELVKNKVFSENPVKRHYTMAVWSLIEERAHSLMKANTGWLLMKKAGLHIKSPLVLSRASTLLRQFASESNYDRHFNDSCFVKPSSISLPIYYGGRMQSSSSDRHLCERPKTRLKNRDGLIHFKRKKAGLHDIKSRLILSRAGTLSRQFASESNYDRHFDDSCFFKPSSISLPIFYGGRMQSSSSEKHLCERRKTRLKCRDGLIHFKRKKAGLHIKSPLVLSRASTLLRQFASESNYDRHFNDSCFVKPSSISLPIYYGGRMQSSSSDRHLCEHRKTRLKNRWVNSF